MERFCSCQDGDGQLYIASNLIKFEKNCYTSMKNNKEEFGFWAKYKHFASNEILLYVIMIVGIALGIIIFG
ncbi:hypothetical protein [Olivibacter sitiensis]|uniref:hypothetical protein n=1 Tax=Olivibacter sitiensis TaxID=376470 RepID=UPI00056511C3|nr:hypothetical protein [Olivibacter sitiensis]